MKVGLFSCVLILSLSAGAEVLFEGYYRVLLEKKPVGFSVLRHETTKRGFQVHQYSNVQLPSKKRTIETLKARSNSLLEPQSYEYTRREGEKVVFLSKGTFYKTKKLWKVVGKTSKKTFKKTFSKPPLLSAFIPLAWSEKMRTSPKLSYAYEVFEEKKGRLVKGSFRRTQLPQFWIQDLGGVKSRLRLTERAEILETQSSQWKLKHQLVPSLEFISQALPVKELKSVFKKLPKGNIHSLRKDNFLGDVL